jgi:hypothetical protein
MARLGGAANTSACGRQERRTGSWSLRLVEMEEASADGAAVGLN